MSETLVRSDLAQSREDKNSAVDYSEREKVVATQAARIIGKMIKRANESGLAYSGDAYSMVKDGPIPGTRLKTGLKQEYNGTGEINQSVDGIVGETGIHIGAVPGEGIDTTLRSRSGGQENNRRLHDMEHMQAVANMPAQLSEMRGHLAEEEIAKAKFLKELDDWVDGSGPRPGSS